MAKNNSTITNSLRKDTKNSARLEQLSHLKRLQRKQMRGGNDCYLRKIFDRPNFHLITGGVELNNLIFCYEYQDLTIGTEKTHQKIA